VVPRVGLDDVTSLLALLGLEHRTVQLRSSVALWTTVSRLRNYVNIGELKI
jgi:hypothetical protein